MTRCCVGTTHVVPNAPDRLESWAVLCLGCDKVLAVVDGPRDEVYAWL